MADFDLQVALMADHLAARLAAVGGRRCRLIKLASATGALLRTDTVDGRCVGPPALGRLFMLLGAPLTPGTDWRFVNTTPVRRIEPQQAGVLRFWTESGSVYLWEPLPDSDSPSLPA